MDHIRRERVSHRIVEEISQLILRGEIKDPRVNSLVGLSFCRLAQDGTSAVLGVSSVLGDREIASAVAGLNSAAPFIQSRLGRVIKTRHTPRLTFVEDHSIEEGDRVLQKMKEIGLDISPHAGEPDADQRDE